MTLDSAIQETWFPSIFPPWYLYNLSKLFKFWSKALIFQLKSLLIFSPKVHGPTLVRHSTQQSSELQKKVLMEEEREKESIA